MARESLLGAIVTYVGVAIGFLTTFFVLTTYLSPEEVGLTRILVELATLISGFSMLGLSTSLSRYFPYFQTKADEDPPHHGFLYWILVIVSLGLVISLPLFALGSIPISSLFGQENALLAEYYYAIIPLIICITLWMIAELFSIQLMHLAIPRAIRELLLRILLLLTYTVYALGWVSQAQMIALFVGCYVLCMILAFAYLGRITPLTLRHDRAFITPELRKGFIRYTALAILSVVGTTLAGRMDLLVLTFTESAGLRSVAIFSIGFFLVSVVEIPTRTIISMATARISSTMKDKDLSATQRIYEQTARYQLLSSMVIYLIVLASIDSIISLMPGSKDYTDSAEVFLFLGIAKLVEVSFTACHPIITCSKHYHWTLYYTLWACIVAFVGNYYLIPIWDAMGAAIATLATTVLGYLMIQGFVWARLKLQPFSWRMARIILLGAILLGVSQILPSPAHPIIAIGVRSLLLAVIAFVGIYIFRLAPEGQTLLLEKINRYKTKR